MVASILDQCSASTPVNALPSCASYKGGFTSEMQKSYSRKDRMKRFRYVIDRNNAHYEDQHYRAHWQPLWAILGLTLCSLLTIFSGWAAVYDLAAKTEGVSKRDSIVDLVSAYIGVCDPFGLNLMIMNTHVLTSRLCSSLSSSDTNANTRRN